MIKRERYAISVNLHIRPPRQAGYQPQYHLACYGAAARTVPSWPTSSRC